MPLVGYYCIDNEKIKTEECLSECRLNRRCLTLPTLMYLGREYLWKGKPSTTQLLNPTRLSWLKIKKPYYIYPESRAFSLLGSNHHATLDIFAKLAGLTSEHKIDGEISGILDLLEPDPENEEKFILSDYKTWGSYSVKKALNNDIFDTQMQLNHYRYKLETSKQLNETLNKHIEISRIQVQVTVRDGVVHIPQKRMA